MIQTMQSELFRIRKSRLFWACLVLAAFFVFALALTFYHNSVNGMLPVISLVSFTEFLFSDYSLIFPLTLFLCLYFTEDFHTGTYSITLADLFFFMNNQFSMFFPMVLFILIGSLFYQEYKNKTYINWITYGFSKKKLFLSKVTVSVVIGICFAAVLFIAFGLLVAILNGAGRLTGGISLFLKLAIGFGIEAGVIVFVTTCLGAIVINLSRNIIVTSVVGVIYGFVSCLFIGSERGFVIPGSFAYRVSMFFSDKSTYYEVPISATIGGCISIVFCFIVLFLVGLIVFSHKKKIEN